MEGFRCLGVIAGDWAHPYKTMDKAFEAEEEDFWGHVPQGLHLKGLKRGWQVSLSDDGPGEAEIEYADDACTSIYVKLP